MPVASASARTQFTHLGLYSQRYGSFAGKAAAVVLDPAALIICVHAEDRAFVVEAEDRTFAVAAEDRSVSISTERVPC